MKYLVFYKKVNIEDSEVLYNPIGTYIPDQRYSIETLKYKVKNGYMNHSEAEAFSINEGFSITNNHNISGIINLK